jgi:hypothetical protein
MMKLHSTMDTCFLADQALKLHSTMHNCSLAGGC